MTDYGEYIVSMYCAQSGVKCERIVRCRDCKHRTKEPDPWECGPVTPERWVDWCCFMHRELRSLYGFCAWASKREEDGE